MADNQAFQKDELEKETKREEVSTSSEDISGDDSGIVFTLKVPEFPRVNHSANGKLSGSSPETSDTESLSGKKVVINEQKKDEIQVPAPPPKKMEMTKEELVRRYCLHVFVALIFLVIVISVSLAWHYRLEALRLLVSSQAIFFDPRTRTLTLKNPHRTVDAQGNIGLDMPKWQLPLHCPVVMGGNPHEKECVWKNNAILRIKHFGDNNVACYKISWESLHSKHVPYDCFDVSEGKWYGPSNQSESTYPIKGNYVYQPTSYTLGNNGVFDSLTDFYWLSSTGVGIYITGDDPIQVLWNNERKNKLCILSNYTGPFYRQKHSTTSPQMNYTICNGNDVLKTHKFMQKMFAPVKVNSPREYVFSETYWSLKSTSDDVNQTSFHDLLQSIRHYGFRGGVVSIDGNWQKNHGDFDFDSEKFPSMTSLVEDTQRKNFRLSLTVSPYVEYLSPSFHRGMTESLFVRDAGGQVTGLVKAIDGQVTAALDFFNPASKRWFFDKLKRIRDDYDIHSFRLTYGDQGWLPYRPNFYSDEATPDQYRRLASEATEMISDSLYVEHTSRSRHVSQVIPISTRVGLKDKQRCLVDVIEKALTFGLMGYPFVMADGIELNASIEEDLTLTNSRNDRELYIRWLQMASFFPSYQFTVPPWEFDQAVVAMATNLSVLRDNYVVAELKDEVLKTEVKQGFPILRPVWWLDPANLTLHDMEIADEFLVGNNILVAPVLCEGQRIRDVYVPPGVWEDVNLGTFVLGPTVLQNYQVSINMTALFMKRDIVGDNFVQEF